MPYSHYHTTGRRPRDLRHVKEFKCRMDCSIYFRHEFDRNLHEKYGHVEEKTYICPDCDRVYFWSDLQQHARYAHGKKQERDEGKAKSKKKHAKAGRSNKSASYH